MKSKTPSAMLKVTVDDADPQFSTQDKQAIEQAGKNAAAEGVIGSAARNIFQLHDGV
ncbi:MAG: hypothetical protein ACU841_07970 [Gammaproteobacteria bacterium]